jgi:D-sedoheptulose 7-phosphate isomerase
MNPPASALGALIARHLEESARVKRATIAACGDGIELAANWLTAAFGSGRKLLLCGNGGSAGDCQHIAAEFTSVLRQDFPRPALPAIALTTDSSFLTARGNDYGFDGIFARLVEAYGREGDVLIGISTSGSSRNVVEAVREANSRGLRTIAFTGEGGGRLAEIAALAIRVPSSKVQHIQETHIAIGHIICQAVEEQLFARQEAS